MVMGSAFNKQALTNFVARKIISKMLPKSREKHLMLMSASIIEHLFIRQSCDYIFLCDY